MSEQFNNNSNAGHEPATPICILSPDAPESDLYQYLVHVRAQIKKWQALHRDSIAGKNILYGIKAACNMAYAGESLVDTINDIVVEKCAK